MQWLSIIYVYNTSFATIALVHCTEGHSRRKLLVNSAPRPEFGVDPAEQDAGQQGGRATDVDGEHEVDLTCVLDLETWCDYESDDELMICC